MTDSFDFARKPGAPDYSFADPHGFGLPAGCGEDCSLRILEPDIIDVHHLCFPLGVLTGELSLQNATLKLVS
jgi:hypothetical protein